MALLTDACFSSAPWKLVKHNISVSKLQIWEHRHTNCKGKHTSGGVLPFTRHLHFRRPLKGSLSAVTLIIPFPSRQNRSTCSSHELRAWAFSRSSTPGRIVQKHHHVSNIDIQEACQASISRGCHSRIKSLTGLDSVSSSSAARGRKKKVYLNL